MRNLHPDQERAARAIAACEEAETKPVLRYDISTDERVPVTQEWVDEVQSVLVQLSKFRADVRKMAELPLVLKVPL